MPRSELTTGVSTPVDRRGFLGIVGAAIAGVSLAGISASCSSDRPGTTGPRAVTGTVRGAVVDLAGTPQGIGRIYLLQKTGLNVGVHADVDPSGVFSFDAVVPDDYQVSYWGANRASVPEQFHNPVRIAVAPGVPTIVNFQVVVAASGNTGRDINAGDYFFQEQPIGDANGTVVVKFGTTVCWYNVGTMPHTVTGGPWADSGPLAPDANFMWTANQLGVFPYRCSYHAPQMQATLQVVA